MIKYWFKNNSQTPYRYYISKKATQPRLPI